MNTNIGSVMYEPQSIEAPQNTFIDGKIASAGIANFAPLDEQNAKRWYKTPVKVGNLSVTWQLTARHKTSTWDYYITKPGWNPN
ncbi:lytic polysaccharide monooxygenase, partial [Klebsiella pneumoniae]|nr:lytic polysaccharide monooxygenase [Klebsiella pneumoniae]